MNFYEVLGSHLKATDEEIKRAYRSRLRSVHPDSGGTATEFRIVQEAWETLSNPSSKHNYDRVLSKELEEEAKREAEAKARVVEAARRKARRDAYKKNQAQEDELIVQMLKNKQPVLDRISKVDKINKWYRIVLLIALIGFPGISFLVRLAGNEQCWLVPWFLISAVIDLSIIGLANVLRKFVNKKIFNRLT